MGATAQVEQGQAKAFDYAEAALIKAQSYLDSLYNTAQAAANQSTSSVDSYVLNDADIKARIYQFLDTDLAGLPLNVEQQMWDRSRERTVAAMNDAVRQASRRASAAGWEQPPGALYEAIAQAEQAAAMEVAGQARGIAIEHAKLVIDNWRAMLNMEKELVIADSSITGDKIKLSRKWIGVRCISRKWINNGCITSTQTQMFWNGT